MTRTFCKDCIYWDEKSQQSLTKSKEGRCRRHAPTPSSEEAELDMGTIWPATFEDDWCGEAKHYNTLAAELLLDHPPEILVDDMAADLADEITTHSAEQD